MFGLIRRWKILPLVRKLGTQSNSKMGENLAALTGLSLGGFGIFKGIQFYREDKNFGVSAVAKKLERKILDDDELEIRLDTPLRAFSNFHELSEFYKTGSTPTRAFDPPCQKIEEEGQTRFRTNFFVKGPNDSYAKRKVARIAAEVQRTESGVEIRYAVAEIFDMEQLLSVGPEGELKPLRNPIVIVNTRVGKCKLHFM